MSWSMTLTTSTSTPCLSMIAALTSTSPWVWLCAGERFNVQLRNIARRPVKSVLISSMVKPFVRWSDEGGVLLDVQESGTGGREELLHRGVEVGGGAHQEAGGSAEPGEVGPVGVDQRRLPDREVARHLLLADLSQPVVVEQHMLDRGPVLDGGGELHGVLAEAAVTGDRYHGPPGVRCPGTQGGRVAETDRAEVARHQHRLAG